MTNQKTKYLILLLVTVFLTFNTVDIQAQRHTRRQERDSIESAMRAAADSLEAVQRRADSLKVQACHIDSIINYGRRYMGTHYRYGGTTPAGFDCSGFMVYIFSHFNHALPRRASEQFKATHYVKKDKGQRGDLIFFEGRAHNKAIGHVGVITEVLDDGSYNFMHSSTSKGITIDNSKRSAYYSSRFLKVSRVVPPFDPIPPEAFGELAELKDLKEGEDGYDNFKDSLIVRTVTIPAKYHSVKQGETLSSIARKYGTTVDKLAKLNNFKSDILSIGQRVKVQASRTQQETAIIKVPVMPADAITIAENPQQTHVVQSGETLTSLARRYHTTAQEIQKLNNLTSSSIHIGDTLVMAEKKLAQLSTTDTHDPEAHVDIIELAPTEDHLAITEPDNGSTVTDYLVKPGDTLWKIAKQHNTTIERLIELNNLSNESLKAGTTIIVPIG